MRERFGTRNFDRENMRETRLHKEERRRREAKRRERAAVEMAKVAREVAAWRADLAARRAARERRFIQARLSGAGGEGVRPETPSPSHAQ